MTNQTVGNKNQTTRTDVINLLKEDHKKVKSLFAEYEELQGKKVSNDKKAKIVQQICTELTLHALAEEAIVYPAAREAIEDEDLMDEADVEHAGAKKLIAELQAMNPEESHYDAKVTVLKEYIEHHVKEEEKEMFPQLKDSDVDLDQLGQEVINFKEDQKDSELKKSPPKTNTISPKKSETIHRKNS
ncbi:Hemerythrin HHE cation binding domain protein [Nitrosomonas sp. Is79A3]|uniref:hemerythrin domain-containing protein n=1 Tax=Nitrosomonas sp. (strain Is79A3) TaxID=261292 RepID=UPI000215C879